MRIALTGVSGLIGSYTAQALYTAGHQVTGLVRPTSQRNHIEPYVDRFVVGTHDDESCWPDLLKDADAVIHNSIDWSAIGNNAYSSESLNVDLVASIRLMSVSAPLPYIYVSSVAAITDILPRWNHEIEQDHPTRPNSPYGALKAAVEQYLTAEYLGNQRHVAAVRPSAVYGLAPQIERSHGHAIIKQLRETKHFNQPGGGKFVHVEDVANVLRVCVENPKTAGQIFNLADCYARWADWAQIAAEELGISEQVKIDFSSPESSKNTFSKNHLEKIGVPLNRGHRGIRSAIRELIEAVHLDQAQ